MGIEVDTARRPGVWSWLSSLIAGTFIGWCAVVGAQDLWRGLQAGRFLNRRGPDIRLDDTPLVFWALSGFYGAGVLFASGLAIVCLLIALCDATGKKVS